ncbi:MAG: mevalonate kinase [bacterium]
MSPRSTGAGAAPGKVILFGEHAAVHGRPAVAAAIDRGLGATAEHDADGPIVRIPSWGRDGLVVRLHDDKREFDAIARAFATAIEIAGFDHKARIGVTLEGELPLGVGLGSSAAFAVATIRALVDMRGERLDDAAMLAAADRIERVFHGTPSGLDHTTVTLGGCLRFRRGASQPFVPIALGAPVPIVVAWTAREGGTRDAVARLRDRYARHHRFYDRLFDAMAEVAEAGVDALEAGDHETLGALFDLNHGYLNAAGVSHPANEEMVDTARKAGALGAKLTGAGCGGAIIAVAPDAKPVVEALTAAGYDAFATTIE